jgi:hypothetical protein
MIVNAYAVLAAFVGLLQLAFGLLVIRFSFDRGGIATKSELEERPYLLLLLSFLLIGANLASWPLLYSLLQSYVPSWPDVMCIYGVTQIGRGSLGSSRHLPWLLVTVQCTKPLLVFLGGSWFVLYLANRATRTAVLMPRLLRGLLPLGVVSVVDSVCVASYLAIGKQEHSLSAGCCTSQLADRSRVLSESLLGAGSHPWLTAILVLLVTGLCLGILTVIRGRVDHRRFLPGLIAGALIAMPLGGLFLVEIASPVLLERPHYCPYDLIGEVPESVLGVVLFVLGGFSIGWAGVLGRWGRVEETQSVLPRLIGSLLFLGLFGYLGSMIMFIVEFSLS